MVLKPEMMPDLIMRNGKAALASNSSVAGLES